MGIVLDQNEWRSARGSNQIILNFSIFIALFVLILALCAGKAWAHDPHEGAYTGASPYFHQAAYPAPSFKKSSPPPVPTDACVPLLDSVRQSPSEDAVNRNQRAAGQIAVLGLALGMRFALEPSPNQPRIAENGIPKAIKIVQYRNCLKQKALLSQ